MDFIEQVLVNGKVLSPNQAVRSSIYAQHKPWTVVSSNRSFANCCVVYRWWVLLIVYWFVCYVVVNRLEHREKKKKKKTRWAQVLIQAEVNCTNQNIEYCLGICICLIIVDAFLHLPFYRTDIVIGYFMLNYILKANFSRKFNCIHLGGLNSFQRTTETGNPMCGSNY